MLPLSRAISRLWMAPTGLSLVIKPKSCQKGLILLAGTVATDHVGESKNRHETHGGDLLRRVTLPSMTGGDYKPYGLGHGSLRVSVRWRSLRRLSHS